MRQESCVAGGKGPDIPAVLGKDWFKTLAKLFCLFCGEEAKTAFDWFLFGNNYVFLRRLKKKRTVKHKIIFMLRTRSERLALASVSLTKGVAESFKMNSNSDANKFYTGEGAVSDGQAAQRNLLRIQRLVRERLLTGYRKASQGVPPFGKASWISVGGRSPGTGLKW